MMLVSNHRKLLLVSAAIVAFSIVNGYFMFPGILKFMLTRNLQLRPGSQMRPMFQNIPFPLVFKMYIFNVTNAEDVLKGAKPIVSEVGPYMFEDWKLRDDVQDDEENDTLTYTLKNRYIFLPHMSNGLTGDEIVTVPHLVMMGAVLTVKRDREPMLPFVVKAMQDLFNPTSIFVPVRAMDLMFDGFVFNCEGEEFASKAVCTTIKSNADSSGIKVVNSTHLSISLLGHKNNTAVGRFKIFRGVKNIRDMGRIITVNDKGMQDIYEGDNCNQIHGTDSTVFPPFLEPDEGLWTFTPEICMSLKSTYVRKSSYDGMPTSFYSIDLGDFKNDPEKQCFCYDDDCPPKGTLDLMACTMSPIYGSKPHFLDADPALLEAVEGLHPNRSLHDIFVNFEAISGTPFEGAKRLQFNMKLMPIAEFEVMAHLPEALLPLVWVEESVQLNKTYTNLLKYQLFLVKKVNATLKWMGIIGGTIGILFASVMLATQGSSKVPVSSTPTAAVIEVGVKSAESVNQVDERDRGENEKH